MEGPEIVKVFAVCALLLSAALVLAGCTAEPTVVENSSVTVATGQSFFSLNDKTSYGDSPGNSAILQAVSSSFNSYNAVPKLVWDSSFGSAQLLSRNPLIIKYTIAPEASWSDGVAVSAADLLLAWAANSGVLNTKGFDDSAYVDQETGQYARPFPPGVVYFDGAVGEGLKYVTQTPVIGDDGRSLTLTYDHYFADWPLVLQVGLPAHVVAAHALNLTGSTKQKGSTPAKRQEAASDATAALVEAIRKDDTVRLAAIADSWNSGFNFDSLPRDRSLLVSTGPYTITGFTKGEQLTLTANPQYRGAHSPVFETVIVRFMADPLTQVKALKNGTVDVISPQLDHDVVSALTVDSNATVENGVDGTYEHLDLRFTDSKSGHFKDARVREAFLKVVPRQQILDAIVTPVQPDAGLRSSQLFLPGAPGYESAVAGNGSDEYAEVDVAGAKRLLTEAGVVSPTVCILFDPANPKRLKEFHLIQQSAAAAGFQVTDCSSPDWVNLLATPGTYDASLFAWKVTNLSFTGQRAIFGTGERNNLNKYSNSEVDALFDTLAIETDSAKQTAIRHKIDRLLWSDAYGVTLFQNPVVLVHRDAVSGVTLAPLSPGVLWNVWEWHPVTSKPSGE